MRVRRGLVSNSSSSSFVVVLPHEPSTVEEVKKLLYGRRKTKNNISTLELAEKVLEQMGPEDETDIADELDGCFWEDAPKGEDPIDNYISSSDSYKKRPGWGNFWAEGIELTEIPAYPTEMHKVFQSDRQKYRRLSNKWQKQMKAWAKENSKAIFEKFKGKFICTFHFSDNDGSIWSELEHGRTFGKFPHVVISHH